MKDFAQTLANSSGDNDRLILRVVSEDAEFSSMAEEWERLCRECPDSEYFVSWPWLQTWWNEYGKDASLRIYSVRASSGELLGVLPTYIKERKSFLQLKFHELRFIGTGAGPQAGYFDLVARPRDRGRVSRVVIPSLLSDSAVWDVLQLESMPAESPLTRRLLKDLPGQADEGLREERPIVELPPEWSHYLQMVPDEVRESIKHTRERLSFDGALSVDMVSSSWDVKTAMEDLFRLGARDKTLGLDARQRDLLMRVARKFADRDQVRCFVLRQQTDTIAVLLGFWWQSTLYCTTLAVRDPRTRQDLCLLLASFAIEEAIAMGCQRCDFLGIAGNAGLSLAPQSRETVSVTAYRDEGRENFVRWARRMGAK